MVQVILKIANENEGGCQEYGLIEMQGDLESRSEEPFEGKTIGNLLFTKTGEPLMIIGHHTLHGKVEKLEKPFGMFKKASADGTGTQYSMTGVIRQKIIFKSRPTPIIANVPKKL